MPWWQNPTIVYFLKNRWLNLPFIKWRDKKTQAECSISHQDGREDQFCYQCYWSCYWKISFKSSATIKLVERHWEDSRPFSFREKYIFTHFHIRQDCIWGFWSNRCMHQSFQTYNSKFWKLKQFYIKERKHLILKTIEWYFILGNGMKSLECIIFK